MDHLGSLESTHKNYKYVLVRVDPFTKFVWINPKKSTMSAETLSKLNVQKAFFVSPLQIIIDQGMAFTSSEFSEYCSQEEILLHLITTGPSRANMTNITS